MVKGDRFRAGRDLKLLPHTGGGKGGGEQRGRVPKMGSLRASGVSGCNHRAANRGGVGGAKSGSKKNLEGGHGNVDPPVKKVRGKRLKRGSQVRGGHDVGSVALRKTKHVGKKRGGVHQYGNDA